MRDHLYRPSPARRVKRMALFGALPLLVLGALCQIPPPTSKPLDGIDSLVVRKGERRMEAYKAGALVRSYAIALGREPVGDKQVQGDMRTPEGLYTINDRNPHSGYHKNLGISYPNAEDRREAKALVKDPGGDIKIHGLPNGKGAIGKLHRSTDWTWGCIAVTDEEIDELYEHVALGAPIRIMP